MKGTIVYILVTLPVYMYLAANLSGMEYLCAVVLLLLATVGSRLVGYMEK